MLSKTLFGLLLSCFLINHASAFGFLESKTTITVVRAGKIMRSALPFSTPCLSHDGSNFRRRRGPPRLLASLSEEQLKADSEGRSDESLFEQDAIMTAKTGLDAPAAMADDAAALPGPVGAGTTPSIGISNAPPADATRPFLERPYLLAIAGAVGALTGLNVAAFKLSVEAVRDVFYGDAIGPFPAISEVVPLPLIPAIGGLGVGLIILLGRGQPFPPGLRDTVSEADADAAEAYGWRIAVGGGDGSAGPSAAPEDRVRNAPGPGRVASDAVRYGRKAVASVVTLGSGNSLGPEGPSVEAGMSVSRLMWELAPPAPSSGDAQRDIVAATERSRLLLACGAAAGVSAGFNAPLSGVFFVLEIVQQSLNPMFVERWAVSGEKHSAGSVSGPIRVGDAPIAKESVNISAILLASVISSLVSKVFLEDELALRASLVDLRSPLQEFPLFLVLGAIAGIVAALFSGAAQASKKVFDGCSGPQPIQTLFSSIPTWSKPTIGALFCGVVATVYPQVLFFGYETLNTILASTSCKTADLLQLLGAKFATTAVAASSGLVGGTFAPSLFLGGTLGASFHNIVEFVLHGAYGSSSSLSGWIRPFELSNMPTYAVVGAASVLSALFRAPLTATLLLFECTHNYDVILPLMASASMGSLTGDVIESVLKERKRELDNVSWGDLALRNDEEDGRAVDQEEERSQRYFSALTGERRR